MNLSRKYKTEKKKKERTSPRVGRMCQVAAHLHPSACAWAISPWPAQLLPHCRACSRLHVGPARKPHGIRLAWPEPLMGGPAMSDSSRPWRSSRTRDSLADFRYVFTEPPLGRRGWRNRPSQLGLAPPLYNPAALAPLSISTCTKSPSEPWARESGSAAGVKPRYARAGASAGDWGCSPEHWDPGPGF